MTMKKMHTLVVGDDEFDVVDDELTERVETLEDDVDELEENLGGILEIADPAVEYVNIQAGDNCTDIQMNVIVSGNASTLFPEISQGTFPLNKAVVTFANGSMLVQICLFDTDIEENAIHLDLKSGIDSLEGTNVAVIPVSGTIDENQEFGGLLNANVVSVDETAEIYPYLFRQKNQKAYVLSEDKERVELKDADFEDLGASVISDSSGVASNISQQAFRWGKMIFLDFSFSKASAETQVKLFFNNLYRPVALFRTSYVHVFGAVDSADNYSLKAYQMQWYENNGSVQLFMPPATGVSAATYYGRLVFPWEYV